MVVTNQARNKFLNIEHTDYIGIYETGDYIGRDKISIYEIYVIINGNRETLGIYSNKTQARRIFNHIKKYYDYEGEYNMP